MKTLKIIYAMSIAAAVLFAAYVYGLNFNTLSETDMISASFIWCPLSVFGVSGFLTLKKSRSLLLAISFSIISALLMIVFFGIIWPML